MDNIFIEIVAVTQIRRGVYLKDYESVSEARVESNDTSGSTTSNGGIRVSSTGRPRRYGWREAESDDRTVNKERSFVSEDGGLCPRTLGFNASRPE